MKIKAFIIAAFIATAAALFWLIPRNTPENSTPAQPASYADTSNTRQGRLSQSAKDGTKVNHTNAPQAFSNSVAILLASSYSWWLGDKPLPLDDLGSKELATFQHGVAETVSNVVAMDISESINEAVRERERALQRLAAQVSAGSKISDVISVIGRPDVVDLIEIERADDGGHIGGIETYEVHRTNVVPSIAITNEVITAISYWPRVGVPFNGKNGQGYRVLYLAFDQNGILKTSFWEQPSPVIRGRLAANPQEKSFWNGEFEKSPPPFGMAWR